MYQNCGNIPNCRYIDYHMYQMAIRWSKWPNNLPTFFHSKYFRNLPKLVFLVWKDTIWQPGVTVCSGNLHRTCPGCNLPIWKNHFFPGYIHPSGNGGPSVFQSFSKSLSPQGCQMVCFQTKNPNLGKFWSVLQRKMLVYFIDPWSIIRSFVIFYGHLV
jgi:hypothetical protein